MNLVYILIVFSLLYVLQMFLNKNVFLKLVVVTYLFLTSSAIYFSFETYKGWPSQEKITKAILVGVEIVQPTDINEGAIYLWVYDESAETSLFEKLFSYKPKGPTPRAYSIPYSENAKGKFEEAKKQLELGATIELTSGEESPEIEQEQGNGNKEGNANASDVEDYETPSIRIVPPNEILRKK